MNVERVREFVDRVAPIAARLGMALGLTLATISAAQEARADSEIGLVPQGITQVMVPLDELTAVVIRTQVLDVAGMHLSVDPENHPDSVIVIGFIANKPVNVPITAYGNMAFGIHTSDINANSHKQRLAELDRVIQEQVSRSFNEGECGLPTGCSTVRVVGLGAHPQDDGSLTYDLVSDDLVNRDQSVAVAPNVTLPESAPAPIYPDNISQAVSSFGGNAGEWDRNNSGAWHFNSPNQAETIRLNGFTMDGYNKDGPFVAGGFMQVEALGGTVWSVSGPAELDKLLEAVRASNPGKQIQVVRSQ